ncbi:oxidoreductase [Streptomyces acidiscabies]|uniref:Oxidoreductase n=3 Tax=Streptomyces acidiscabies TaxID=42234 RepID=A0AAP6BGB7_9ACTN|nr:oxidoreductase [Streptomyces acidiscabies]MBP5937863.1 SDR family NAD(P)-dependent oxidoreductase [Streptomyces sp. LBUM 1476]MBZ3914021.1 SDR family NAD(P)-dependent oxidoreductase [Streptomyces acidiscabies]MDX2964245.1 oxidoreductase [Streptomyces acidiscabies]MDX3016784.1 oxidoreductase [Streptomyces acidiscabies]MDX3794087.1 oxidoreductase [Streptomyces acidiscabies]
MDTKRPVALVTGASSGIGEATALALVEAGFEVIGTSRNTAKVAPRDGVTFLDLDVSSDDSVATLVRQVIDRFGRIDVLVNNAGIGSSGATEESSLAQHRHVLDVNVLGVVRMTKAVLPHMRAQGRGRIVNLSSIYGFVPQPFMAAYIASKHAVEGYSESVDHEVREHGVRVLLVEPGGTSTAFEGNLVQPDTPLPVYAEQRRTVDEVIAGAVTGGDAPAVVARAVVAAATARRPRLRTTAGPLARRLSLLRRVAPARVFDRQMRKFNGLTLVRTS